MLKTQSKFPFLRIVPQCSILSLFMIRSNKRSSLSTHTLRYVVLDKIPVCLLLFALCPSSLWKVLLKINKFIHFLGIKGLLYSPTYISLQWSKVSSDCGALYKLHTDSSLPGRRIEPGTSLSESPCFDIRVHSYVCITHISCQSGCARRQRISASPSEL